MRPSILLLPQYGSVRGDSGYDSRPHSFGVGWNGNRRGPPLTSTLTTRAGYALPRPPVRPYTYHSIWRRNGARPPLRPYTYHSIWRRNGARPPLATSRRRTNRHGYAPWAAPRPRGSAGENRLPATILTTPAAPEPTADPHPPDPVAPEDEEDRQDTHGNGAEGPGNPVPRPGTSAVGVPEETEHHGSSNVNMISPGSALQQAATENPPPRPLPDARVRFHAIRISRLLDNFHVAWLQKELDRWADEGWITKEQRENLGVNVGFSSSVPGMPFGEGSTRDIQDAYLLPKDATVPSLVVECGRAEEEDAMLADMRNWFRKGDGKVKKVILMVWVMKQSWIIGARIEVYEFDNQKLEENLVQEWVFLPESPHSRSQSLQMTVEELFGANAGDTSPDAGAGVTVRLFGGDFCDAAVNVIKSSKGLRVPGPDEPVSDFQSPKRAVNKQTSDNAEKGSQDAEKPRGGSQIITTDSFKKIDSHDRSDDHSKTKKTTSSSIKVFNIQPDRHKRREPADSASAHKEQPTPKNFSKGDKTTGAPGVVRGSGYLASPASGNAGPQEANSRDAVGDSGTGDHSAEPDYQRDSNGDKGDSTGQSNQQLPAITEEKGSHEVGPPEQGDPNSFSVGRGPDGASVEHGDPQGVDRNDGENTGEDRSAKIDSPEEDNLHVSNDANNCREANRTSGINDDPSGGDISPAPRADGTTDISLYPQEPLGSRHAAAENGTTDLSSLDGSSAVVDHAVHDDPPTVPVVEPDASEAIGANDAILQDSPSDSPTVTQPPITKDDPADQTAPPAHTASHGTGLLPAMPVYAEAATSCNPSVYISEPDPVEIAFASPSASVHSAKNAAPDAAPRPTSGHLPDLDVPAAPPDPEPVADAAPEDPNKHGANAEPSEDVSVSDRPAEPLPNSELHGSLNLRTAGESGSASAHSARIVQNALFQHGANGQDGAKDGDANTNLSEPSPAAVGRSRTIPASDNGASGDEPSTPPQSAGCCTIAKNRFRKIRMALSCGLLSRKPRNRAR